MTAGWLVRPRWLSLRRGLRNRPAHGAVVAVLVGAFWLGLFLAVLRLLDWVDGLGGLGAMLAERMLALVLVALLLMLLVSATITALGVFYLAEDLTILRAAPVPLRRLHRARFLETLMASSWMVLVVLAPLLAAYGVHFGGGLAFGLGVLASIVPFLVVPVALGVLLATGLVLLVPARGARDGLAIASAIGLALLVVTVRLLAPERVAHPSGLVGIAAYLADTGAPASPWLPSTWASEVLVATLGLRAGDAGFHAAVLASTALVLFLVSATVLEAVYPLAWTRAQIGRSRGGDRDRWAWRALRSLTALLPGQRAVVLSKDLVVFLRDPAQWSQLVLVGLLVAVYVYNFVALPLHGADPVARTVRKLATVLNLGLATFVATAVAVRFVYPLPSLEGRAWWIVRTAPVALAEVWAAKFWAGFLPLSALTLGLAGTTNELLGTPRLLSLAVSPVLVTLVAAVVSLGLAFGAHYADLDGRDAGRLATGPGAILYMLTAVVLIAVVVTLTAGSVDALLAPARGDEAGATLVARGLVAAGLGGGIVVSLGAAVAARRVGLRAFARLVG